MDEQREQEPDMHKKALEKSNKFLDPWAHIELTEQEIDGAQRRLRQEKGGRLNEIEYMKKMNQPVEYPTYTKEKYAEYVLAKIRVVFPGFIIDKWNERIFNALVLYFLRDPEFEKLDENFSLEKGIAINGKVGCGKTSMLRGFNVNPTNSFRFISCTSISDEYTHKEYGGQPIILKYAQIIKVRPADYWGQNTCGMLFDDLGVEDISKHFGNQKNVMESILQARYDNYNIKGKTHVTTNLSAQQIEDFYGLRVRSRLREMCNWLVFDPNAPDRRK